VYEFPVGYTIPAHSHKGEEAVYVLEGAKLKRPDGTEFEIKTGTYNVVPRDLVHGGATMLGPGSLKLFAAHVIDKGGPIRILPKQ
jgi:quercetin dioxygenase-like cupin family protein